MKCEKSLSEFSSNFYALRTPESEKNGFYLFCSVSTEFNSTTFDGKMNSAIPSSHVEDKFQYIASIRFWNKHKCSGIVISQDHVMIVPGCFYENGELVGGLHVYQVWIPIPYHGNPGRYFTIADIDVHTRHKDDIGLLLVSHNTKS